MSRPSASTANSACASKTTWSSPKPAPAGLRSRPIRSTIRLAWRSKGQQCPSGPFALAKHRDPPAVGVNAVDVDLVRANHPVDVDQALVADLRCDLRGGELVA